MFTELAHRLGSFFSYSHAHDYNHERDEYLASSTDLAELERRMKHYDDDSRYPFHVHSSVTPRDWIA
jgi:hypothetical protein